MSVHVFVSVHFCNIAFHMSYCHAIQVNMRITCNTEWHVPLLQVTSGMDYSDTMQSNCSDWSINNTLTIWPDLSFASFVYNTVCLGLYLQVCQHCLCFSSILSLTQQNSLVSSFLSSSSPFSYDETPAATCNTNGSTTN